MIVNTNSKLSNPIPASERASKWGRDCWLNVVLLLVREGFLWVAEGSHIKTSWLYRKWSEKWKITQERGCNSQRLSKNNSLETSFRVWWESISAAIFRWANIGSISTFSNFFQNQHLLIYPSQKVSTNLHYLKDKTMIICMKRFIPFEQSIRKGHYYAINANHVSVVNDS